MSYHVSSLAMRQTAGTSTMKRNQNAVTMRRQRNQLGPITNTLLLALILSAMGLLYLTQITKTSTFSYQVSELDQQKSALIEERQSLEVEAARLQALERIRTSEVAKQLTKPQTVEFVQ